MVPQKAHIRLTVDVHYDLNGTDLKDLQENLQRLPKIGYAVGVITEDTEAEIVEWEYKTKVISVS